MKCVALLLLVGILMQTIPHGWGVVPDFSPTGTRFAVTPEEDPPTLEPILGSSNFRLNGKKGKDERPWFNGRDPRHIHCVRAARCEKLRNPTCFGSKLPYALTSLDLTDSMNQEESRERLIHYEVLRNVPKCWAVIQPFLCAVYVPKCDKIGNRDMVFLPSLEQCRITLEPCRLLYNTSFFPEFLRCNETLFPSKCNNDVREMKFNTTGQCMAPLVATDSAASYYNDIEGCGVQCRDPMYTDDEHRQINNLNFWCAGICLLCNLMVITTFLIDWKNANKYPAVIIFYINVCFFINCLAWLAQFLPGNREDIVCRKDGTLRHSEPSAGENLSCIAVFVSVYYSLIAAMVWFVILTYSWHMRAIGNVHRAIDKKSSYFHLIAWSLPLVLTIATMALSEVDGNSIAGICFVGQLNHPIRAGFLIGPLAGVLMVGGFFIVRGMITLFALKRFVNEIKSTSASQKIHSIILRMGIPAVVAFVFIVAVIMCQINEFRNMPQWTQSLRRLIICKISSSSADSHRTCKLDSRPSVALLQLQLLCLFFSGIVMSSWCWTRQSYRAWKRYIRKKLGFDTEDDSAKSQKQKQKYKIIAQTYAKRKEFQDTGRLSVSFYEAYPDPAGLNFDINDLNSAATNEMSSTWCNYLPKIARRRSAIANGCSAPRKSSVDSEFSVSVRQFSMESRRNSMDSQVSVKIAEVQTKVACRSSHVNHRGAGGAHRSATGAKTRHGGKRFTQHVRRGSSTSVESQIITSNYPKLGGGVSGRDKRMRRRSANAGLVNANDINSFITQFPELTRNFQGMATTSDDDNVSRTSLKIQDSRLDVVVRQNGAAAATSMGRYHAAELGDDGPNGFGGVNGGRASKNSQKSVRSAGRKSAGRTHSQKKKRKAGAKTKTSTVTKTNNKQHQRDINSQSLALFEPHRMMGANGHGGVSFNRSDDDSSFTSYSSEFALPIGGGVAAIGANGIQSSYSGVSKTSCDVGTQANAYEIATQTMSLGEGNGLMKAVVSVNKMSARAILSNNGRRGEEAECDGEHEKRGEYGEYESDDDEERYTENHRLMVGAAAAVSSPVVRLSEAEKLRMLLLPSK